MAMDNLILNVLSHVSWHILIVSDLPFILCQLSIDILEYAETHRLFEDSNNCPSGNSMKKINLERRLNFLSMVWLLLCFVLLLSEKEMMWLSLISGYPVWEQRHLTPTFWAWVWLLETVYFLTLTFLHTVSCITPAFSWLRDSDELFFDSPEEHRVLHKENYMGCYWIFPYHYCKSGTQIE